MTRLLVNKQNGVLNFNNGNISKGNKYIGSKEEKLDNYSEYIYIIIIIILKYYYYRNIFKNYFNVNVNDYLGLKEGLSKGL